MASKLELIENYVVYSDTISGIAIGEYAINHCVYTEDADKFEIKETIDNGKLPITKSDILAGNWVDSVGTPFTEGTMRDFLRANTGFNTAGGGSPALPYKLYSGLIRNTGVFNHPLEVLHYSSFNGLIDVQTSGTTGFVVIQSAGDEFVDNKTSVLVTSTDVGYIVTGWHAIGTQTVYVRVTNSSGTPIDFATSTVEIKVYP